MTLFKLLQQIALSQGSPNAGVDLRASGLPSGIGPLDDLTGGFRGGDVVLVASRPRMGKTSLILDMARHVALLRRAATLVVTPGAGQETMQRMIAAEARVNLERLCANQATGADWVKLRPVAARLNEARLHVLNDAVIEADQLEVAARASGAAIIFIDPVRVLTDSGEDHRTGSVVPAVRTLKRLAQNLGVRVVGTVDLSRKPEQRGRRNRRPLLTDLADSGALSALADVIMFIYRDEVYRPDTADKGEAEVTLIKQDQQPVTIKLSFFGHHCRFAEQVARS